MNTLQGGFLGETNQVEVWLNLLFERDAAQPGAVIEHPERLVYVDVSSAEGEEQARQQYSFGKIKEAFVLHKICQPPEGGESVVKSLADNFLIQAFALWNLVPKDRSTFLRAQAGTLQGNTQVAESIGSLPFCRIQDVGKNEIFLYEEALDAEAQLKLINASLEAKLAEQQQLIAVAAEKQLVFQQTLDLVKQAAADEIQKVVDFKDRQYKELQVQTDVLVAEQNADLFQEVRALRQDLDSVREEKRSEATRFQQLFLQQEGEMEKRVSELRSACETRLQEIYNSAAKDVELMRRECNTKLSTKDKEYTEAVASKLRIEKDERASEVSLLQSKLEGRMTELQAKERSLADLKHEFAMLSKQVMTIQEEIINAREGISLREQAIAFLRKQKEDQEISSQSRINALTDQVNSLALKLSYKEKDFSTEMKTMQTQQKLECNATVRQIVDDSARKLKETEERLADNFDDKKRQILREREQELRALRDRYKQEKGDDGGCTIV
jgi:hypothetical protein